MLLVFKSQSFRDVFFAQRKKKARDPFEALQQTSSVDENSIGYQCRLRDGLPFSMRKPFGEKTNGNQPVYPLVP